jgi:hypothetical protein
MNTSFFASPAPFAHRFYVLLLPHEHATHTCSHYDHDFLCRTQSEDSPKSPLDMSYIKPSTGYMMTTAEIHSRTSSRQSQLETSRSDTMSTDNFYIDSYHSQDSANTAFSNSNSHDNFMISRRASHTLQTEPIFIGRNELEQMRVPRAGQPTYEFESHSLPRRTCIHHTPNEEYHTHSLPRREHHHHYLHEHEAKVPNGSVVEPDASQQRRQSMSYQDAHASYVNVSTPDTYSLSRRSSAHLQPHQLVSSVQAHHHQHQPQQPPLPPSDEMCSTCSSETESSSGSEEESESETEQEDDDVAEEEKEIFIDFKPAPSPSSVATVKKKKKLVKAMSEGEILIENAGRAKQISGHAASEEDLLPPPKDYAKNLEYTDTPIRDEDVFKVDIEAPSRYCRETFRKRSVSLEDPLADDESARKSSRNLRANGSSPGSPDVKSTFASSDDITRDHSDGNWNESQATVLPRPPR